MGLFRLTKNILGGPAPFYRYLRYCVKQYESNELLGIANRFGTDKGLPGHGYARIYDAFLRKFRDASINLCEIGLLHIKHQGEDFFDRLHSGDLKEIYDIAPSLDMWEEYFPNGRIIGFDIVKFDRRDKKSIIIKGDQSSRDDLGRIVEIEPEFDVIIDDALHASQHQQITFSFLFKYLKPGGVYFIEDLHWQPEEFESEEVPKTIEVLRHFVNTRKWISPVSESPETRLIERELDEVYFFDSLKDANIKKSSDALAVITKRGNG
jgi:hypothetical protein